MMRKKTARGAGLSPSLGEASPQGGAGGTDRAQQPAARGGGSSLSVAAATPTEPRQPRTPRQPQDAGGGPRRGSPSVADGTGVAASTAPRQRPARGSLATSLVSSPTAAAEAVTTKPELRRQSEVATESTRADRATNAMSCPDLETMVATSGLKLPAVVGPPRPGSPRTSSRTRRHRSDRQLPKFSISLEEAEAWAVQAGLSSGPASLPAPALTPAPASKHFPEIPSPLVRSEQRPSMVRSTSATGLSLMIPPPASRVPVSSGASTNKNLTCDEANIAMTFAVSLTDIQTLPENKCV